LRGKAQALIAELSQFFPIFGKIPWQFLAAAGRARGRYAPSPGSFAAAALPAP